MRPQVPVLSWPLISAIICDVLPLLEGFEPLTTSSVALNRTGLLQSAAAVSP